MIIILVALTSRQRFLRVLWPSSHDDEMMITTSNREEPRASLASVRKKEVERR